MDGVRHQRRASASGTGHLVRLPVLYLVSPSLLAWCVAELRRTGGSQCGSQRFSQCGPALLPVQLQQFSSGPSSPSSVPVLAPVAPPTAGPSAVAPARVPLRPLAPVARLAPVRVPCLALLPARPERYAQHWSELRRVLVPVSP
jgi:hypothetical protein